MSTGKNKQRNNSIKTINVFINTWQNMGTTVITVTTVTTASLVLNEINNGLNSGNSWSPVWEYCIFLPHV
jgi:hypothetical protein